MALVEHLHRVTDGVPVKQTEEGVFEDRRLWPDIWPIERVGPCSVNMADDRQGRPRFVAEQGLRERPDEGSVADSSVAAPFPSTTSRRCCASR